MTSRRAASVEQSLVLCKAKVIGAHVTSSEVRYWASLWVDGLILQEAGLRDYEKVLVVNFANAERFETYVRSAAPNSGVVRLAGGAAKLGATGDEIGFLSFAIVSASNAEGWKPKVVVLGESNQVLGVSDGDPGSEREEV